MQQQTTATAVTRLSVFAVKGYNHHLTFSGQTEDSMKQEQLELIIKAFENISLEILFNLMSMSISTLSMKKY